MTTANPVTHTAGGSRAPVGLGEGNGGGVSIATRPASASEAVGGPSAVCAAAGAGCSGAITAAKCPKKSFAILRATPSIRREPTCASLPPTCAWTA